MFIEERHQEILALLEANGKVTIAGNAEKFGISDESARRDLRLLEQKGLCRRTHGGAILPGQVGKHPPADRDFDTMPIYDHYRRIARRAAGYIRENDTVFLTGGSFGHIMLEHLPREMPFTLVVNSADLAKALRAFPRLEVYVTGGKMRPSGSMTDSLAREFVGRLHFDLCFLTGAGLTAEFGLSNGTDETASFQRTVLANSRRRILLLPGEKIGSDAFIRVCAADQFHILITDGGCAEEHLTALKEAGPEVILV